MFRLAVMRSSAIVAGAAALAVLVAWSLERKLAPEALDRETLAQFLAGQHDAGKAPRSVARLSSALRQFLAFLRLEGGPGASPFGSGEATEERMEVWWELSAPFRRTRNLILFDPRGVGRAEPDTDCPELDAAGGAPSGPAAGGRSIGARRNPRHPPKSGRPPRHRG